MKNAKCEHRRTCEHLTLSHPKAHEHCVPCTPMKSMKVDKCVKGMKCEKHVINVTGDNCVNTLDM